MILAKILPYLHP